MISSLEKALIPNNFNKTIWGFADCNDAYVLNYLAKLVVIS